MVQNTKGGSLVGSGSEHLLSKDGSLRDSGSENKGWFRLGGNDIEHTGLFRLP